MDVEIFSVIQPPVGGIYNGSIWKKDDGAVSVLIADGSSLVNGKER